MKKNVDDLRDELKRLEAEMQKLESSLTSDTPPPIAKETSAVKKELESRLAVLRYEQERAKKE